MTRILVLDRGDELADKIDQLAEDLADPAEVVSCTRIGAVGELLDAERPFDVLVAGPSLGTRSGLARLQIIHESLPHMSLVLAFTRRPEATLREVVRTGAVDLLQLPVGDEEMIASLDRAAALARTAPAAAPVAATTPEPVLAASAGHGTTEAARRPGIVYTIASATGGCGKTFYATNLAWFLAHWMGLRVCIVDLDLQFGEVSTALRLRPKYTIFDALQREDADSSDLEDHIEEYTVAHETGIHVLAAPREPSEADRITPPDVTRIISAVRAHFDYVIVDTPPALAETVLAAFDQSDLLYVMATLDLPSVRNMSVFLSTLDRLRIEATNVRLVLNKAETDVGIDIDQVTKLFSQGFESILPYAKEVSRSINLGMPVMAASPEAEISALMAQGMANVLPTELKTQVQAETGPRRTGFRRRIFGK